MLALVSRIRRWWEAADLQPAPAALYRLTCTCGRSTSGPRQERFQVVVCAGCRRELFVLPRSPLPPVADDPSGAALPLASRPARRRWPWLAVPAVLLAAVAGLIVILLAISSGTSPSTALPPEGGRAALKQGQADLSFATARQLLGRGEFYQAVAAAKALLGRQPGALSAAERHRLLQFQAEAALLADLSTESLEEILRHELLRHGAGLQDQEWEEAFRQRYRGKAMVFDSDVWQTPEGKYRLGYRVLAGGEEAGFDLENLRVLQRVPLEQRQRLVFGARLESVVRGRAGGWIVRFQDDSGVLLTEEAAAALCCPALGDDTGKEILRRQRRWALGGDAEQPLGRGN